MTFIVKSSKPVEQPDGSYLAVEQEEVRRTDRKVAEQDVDLISGVLHRKAWIEELK